MDNLSIEEIVKVTNGTLLCGDNMSTIHEVSTNSKEVKEGTLFVPIIGERVDAHDFIPSAMEAGASAVLTSKDIDCTSNSQGTAIIKVNDTIKALQEIATYYRSQYDIPVIGITGSVGKTTTKEMIAAALETKYNVLKTAGNMNSQIGLPLTMFRIDHTHEVAVIEMGISEPNEMVKLAAVAKPTHAVITNIGVSHIGQLGSRENIRKEKLNIVDEFSNDSCLFINGKDDMLSYVLPYSTFLKESDKQKTQKEDIIDVSEATKKSLSSASVITFGIDKECMYFATDIEVTNGHTRFKLNTNTNVMSTLSGAPETVELQVLGEHNVSNALVAIAIANKLGIDTATAKKGLAEYKPLAMRGDIEIVSQVTIIDDTYNASPDSMRGGINVLMELENINRRFAVLADVLELGEHSFDCHYGVGQYIVAKKVDEVITIGKEARAIAKAIEDEKGFSVVHSFDTNEEAITYLKANLKENDAVLVKGSRGMHTDEIVKALKER